MDYLNIVFLSLYSFFLLRRGLVISNENPWFSISLGSSDAMEASKMETQRRCSYESKFIITACRFSILSLWKERVLFTCAWISDDNQSTIAMIEAELKSLENKVRRNEGKSEFCFKENILWTKCLSLPGVSL